MKSSILIVSYLWKDTWSRWREQPSSFLARLFVGALLGAVATVILVAFTLLERSIRNRLETFGLNTLVVREMVNLTDPELLAQTDRPDRLRPLTGAGDKIRLRQLFVRAQTELQQELPVLTYPPDALAMLAPWLGPDLSLIYVSDSLPEETQVRITLQRQSATAVVRPMPTFLRPLSVEQFILAPQGWAPDTERLGFVETTLFRRSETARPMKDYVGAIQTLYALERRNPPQIQSALTLIRELEELQQRQNHWRTVMAGVLGLALALVYGSIAILEFRQNLFIGALLRSLGTPGPFLYFRQWIENGFLANLAALLAIATIAWFHSEIFGTLGFPRAVLDLTHGNPYWSPETALILLCVNIGAFLSSLPVAIGLRKPVGAILN
ncbi:MAG: hypothetical protein AB1813_03660 [Verrucomicrobiota bacterium]|jgi:hypothetical protein